MKLPYFASVFYSALFVGTICDQCDDKIEFASQQEIEVSLFCYFVMFVQESYSTYIMVFFLVIRLILSNIKE